MIEEGRVSRQTDLFLETCLLRYSFCLLDVHQAVNKCLPLKFPPFCVACATTTGIVPFVSGTTVELMCGVWRCASKVVLLWDVVKPNFRMTLLHQSTVISASEHDRKVKKTLLMIQSPHLVIEGGWMSKFQLP